MTNTTSLPAFLPLTYSDSSFTLATDGTTVVELDLNNPLHTMRMQHAMDCKSTIERIQVEVERMQSVAERNLQRLAEGSVWFDSSTSSAIELDKLQDKLSGQIEALKGMDWAISKG
jgi:hypothetical protein